MNRTTKYLHDILGTTTKIAIWVKISSILLFCLSVFVSFHYLFCNFPTKADRKSLSFDYEGLLVGFYGLLVTLLVAWQIYSTIKAKEEVSSTKKELSKEVKKNIRIIKRKIMPFRKDVGSIKSDSQELRRIVSDLESKLDSETVRHNALILALTYYADGIKASLEKGNMKEAFEFYSRAYFNFIIAKPTSDFLKNKMVLCLWSIKVTWDKIFESDYKVKQWFDADRIKFDGIHNDIISLFHHKGYEDENNAENLLTSIYGERVKLHQEIKQQP